MARKLVSYTDPGKKPGFFDRMFREQKVNEYNARVYQLNDEIENNKRVARRMDYQDAWDTTGYEDIFDRVVDAEAYLESGAWRNHAAIAAGLGVGALAAGTGASYLGARNQQQVDGLPTDPLSVAGRMVNGYGTVGTDPLADARNKVAEAGRLVGTDNMLAALADDELAARADKGTGVAGGDWSEAKKVQRMIDERAKELMQEPVVKKDGTVGYMPYDVAQRRAQDDVALELRSIGVI